MVTYDFTLHLRIRNHTAWFSRCVGTTFGHFLLGSHNFMVRALGSCVKWPSLGHLQALHEEQCQGNNRDPPLYTWTHLRTFGGWLMQAASSWDHSYACSRQCRGYGVEKHVVWSRALNQILSQCISIYADPHIWWNTIKKRLRDFGVPWSSHFVLGLPPRGGF